MLKKYIGESKTFKAAALDPRDIDNFPLITVEKNQDYDVDVLYEGPNIIINGVKAIHPDGTWWIVFPNQGRIPYAKDCLDRHWQ